MGEIEYKTPYDAVEAFKYKTNLEWPLTKTLIEIGKDLYKECWFFIEHKYILKNNLLVLNRSKGAESNFFIFVKAKSKNELDIFLSNPSKDKDIQREDLILHHSIKSSDNKDEIIKEIRKLIAKIKAYAEMKPLNEYWGNLHSHIGTINGERVWDDGITEDENWFLQSMLWHHDFHALTSHNWTHNEERLKFIDKMCSSANIVFIPGWENTMTVKDRVKSPHILVLCKNIQTAMKAKYEFLSKKLEGKEGVVTPVLVGVPGPYTKHLNYLKSLHDNLEAALIIAHPSSQNAGIDILDPSIFELIGEKETLKILFNFADGIEQFNFHEVKSGMTRNPTISKFIPRLEGQNKHPLSHMVVNYFAGEHGKKIGLLTFANQDDHYQPNIDSNLISDYSYGYNSLILKVETFKHFQALARKFNSEEFVHALIKRRMPNCEEEIEINPVAFLEIKENEDIDFWENRKKSKMEKIKEWINTQPGYYWNIAKLQFKYWFGNKEQKKEIMNELEKAKSYNESPK
ncbi:MAG: hypothetical protein QXK21_00310 [Candidatus Micrarchaeia archaeon]